MAGGGATDALNFVFPKVGLAMSEIKRNNIANQQAETNLQTSRAAQSAAAEAFGGYDPRSGITWDSGRPAEPGSTLATYQNDPLFRLMGRLNPSGALSSIATMSMSPMKNVRVDGKEMMLNDMGIRNAAAAGKSVVELDKAPAADINKFEHFNAPVDTPYGPREQMYGGNAVTGFGPIGSMGDFSVKATPGVVGDIINTQRLMSTFGTTPRPQNYTPGSDSPPPGTRGALPPATQLPLAGGSMFTPSATGPQTAVPSVVDILRTQITAATRTPEQQAALNKAAENQVTQSTPEYQQKQAAEVQAAKNADASYTAAIDLVDKILSSPKDLSHVTGSIMGLPYLPDVRQGSVDENALIENLKGQVGLQALQAARQGSASGATGFGNLNKGELELVENALGTLSTRQGTPQFAEQLKQIQTRLKTWRDNLHGARPDVFKAQSSAATGAPKASGAFDTQSLVDEARRRGLIK